MSTVPQPMPRHALGLPAGSVRSLLAFGVLAYLWALLWVLLQPIDLTDLKKLKAMDEASVAFVYLQVLMVLILAHFFTAHGKTIGSHVSQRSPLGLPSGSVRFILLAGYLGMAAYMYLHHPYFQLPEKTKVAVLPLVIISAFITGHVLNGVARLVGGGIVPAWAQDLQAWVALIALMLLGLIVLIRFGINTSLPLEGQIDLNYLELGLAGAVGFYFGARS